MNFQQIRDSLGTMDGQYQAKTEITATIKQVKPVGYSQKSGKPGQSLYIELDSGEQDWVKFTGKDVADSPLDHNAEGKRVILKIWPFRPEQAAKTYLYCWIQRQVPQNGSQSSQNTPQAPQQPPQQPNAPQGNQSPDKDARAKAVEVAAMLVSYGKHEDIELYRLADCIVDYIQNGTHPIGVAGAQEQGGESDFPKEPE